MILYRWERSGSVVECLTRDRRAAGRKESNQTNKILYREKTQIRLGINITDTGKREKMLHNLGIHVHNYNILFLLLS